MDNIRSRSQRECENRYGSSVRTLCPHLDKICVDTANILRVHLLVIAVEPVGHNGVAGATVDVKVALKRGNQRLCKLDPDVCLPQTTKKVNT